MNKAKPIRDGTRVRVLNNGYIKKWCSDTTDIGTIISSENKNGKYFHQLKMDCGTIPFNRFQTSELEVINDTTK